MAKFEVLTRERAAPETKEIFDSLKSKIRMVPNLYAFIAHSVTGLPAYLAFEEALSKGVFTAKEREAIFLAVSQVNLCTYCQPAHTVLGKMNGFTEEETIKLRTATIEDERLNAITSLAAEITQTHGRPSGKALQTFLDAGFDMEG
jgi:AhpD family alkylhydroperoxidase